MKKILIVDDIQENIQIIISIFEKNNPEFELFQAPSGLMAFKIAKKIIPDIIITDWDMPQMSGIELIKALKQEKELKDIPIIMSTGVMTTVEHLQEALSAGAVDYIKKPIDEIELVARTFSALNLSEYNKKLISKKNKELIENTLFLVKNNEFNQKLAMTLKELSESTTSKKASNLINDIVSQLNQKIKTDSWERFELSFNSVNDKFYQNLLNDFPNLTQTESKLCAFLKLGLSSKDISAIMYISPDSVKVARYRLRKKLALSKDDNLQAFLSKY